ncbi:MAG: helix-turn-helix domain-containing protein [Eubacteriales bacterium]|nr:helix-turn-helix domain-containing protein [Eubacteriales bacterium]
MFENYNDILTVEEFAEVLRIGTTQAYRILKRGEIAAYKEGKDWKIPKKSVEQYIYNKAFSK